MAVYRITRFAAADMDAANQFSETRRDALEALGSDFIDIVNYGNGKGVVIARYPDQATMDAAAETARKVFGEMIEAGIVEADSVHPHAGDVMNSF